MEVICRTINCDNCGKYIDHNKDHYYVVNIKKEFMEYNSPVFRLFKSYFSKMSYKILHYCSTCAEMEMKK